MKNILVALFVALSVVCIVTLFNGCGINSGVPSGSGSLAGTWEALSSGVQYVSAVGLPIVNALTFDDVNKLCVGGIFNRAGGQSGIEDVAIWNGTTWEALGGSLSIIVVALARSDHNIYAVGHYGGGAGRLYKWDGSSWTQICLVDNTIFAVAVDGSENVYIGGKFTSVDGVPGTSALAKWTGTTWEALGNGVDNMVFALKTDTLGNLYAGGSFISAGGVDGARGIAKWTGTTWEALGSGANIVYTIAVSEESGTSKVYIGGSFRSASGVSGTSNIAQWTGTTWEALGIGVNSRVFSMALDSRGYLYAGGSFWEAGGTSASHIAVWNGTAWEALSSGTDYNVNALAADGKNIYVGGDFSYAGGLKVNCIAKWVPSL